MEQEDVIKVRDNIFDKLKAAYDDGLYSCVQQIFAGVFRQNASTVATVNFSKQYYTLRSVDIKQLFLK